MAEFISLYNNVIGQVTEEHLKIFKKNVDKRKEIIQYAYEAKQQQYIDKLELTKERIANVEKRRRIDGLKLSAKKKSAHEKFLVRLDLRREFEFCKRLTLASELKKRDKDKAKKLEKLKQSILHRKHKNEIKRYMVIYDRQKSTIKQKNALIDKCFEETVSNETVCLEEINEIEEEVEIEPESLEDCSFHQDFKPIEYSLDDSLMSKLIDRMEKLKTNFCTCEQGKAFWSKTQPLWNKMTHCLENILVKIESNESGPIFKAYKDKVQVIQDSMTVKVEPLSLLMQKIMLNDVNYNLSDEMLIEIMKMAKSLSDVGASAAELIHLTRCIVEYEADSKVNVSYMVHGLIERSVFEFTKKRIARKIFVDVRKCIDRLQHINDDGVLPKKMLKSKNKTEVTLFVQNIIDNDEVYGMFDESIDDDADYVALTSGSIVERMDLFVKENLHSFNSMLLKPKLNTKMFQMNKRSMLIELVDQSIISFLELAHQKTANQTTTVKGNQFAEDFKRKCVRTSKVTMVMVYRICRKIAKLLFGMFPTVDQRLRNLEKTADAYMSLVTKRTPRVVYDRRIFKPPVKIDLSYFQRSFDESNPRNVQ